MNKKPLEPEARGQMEMAKPLLRLGVKSLVGNLPALLGLEQHKVVGEGHGTVVERDLGHGGRAHDVQGVDDAATRGLNRRRRACSEALAVGPGPRRSAGLRAPDSRPGRGHEGCAHMLGIVFGMAAHIQLQRHAHGGFFRGDWSGVRWSYGFLLSWIPCAAWRTQARGSVSHKHEAWKSRH